jgi:hypothetical protein
LNFVRIRCFGRKAKFMDDLVRFEEDMGDLEALNTILEDVQSRSRKVKT